MCAVCLCCNAAAIGRVPVCGGGGGGAGNINSGGEDEREHRIERVLMRRLGVDSLYGIVQSMSLVLGAYIN